MDFSSLSVTHRLIGAREAYLCDDLFDETTIFRVADLLKTLRYRRVESSRSGTDVSGGSAEVPEHVSASEPLFARMKSFAEDTFAARGFHPHRLYVNSTVYGDMYYPHRDFAENEPHITVLYYANPKWNADWGGETILYDDDGDAQLAVTPRPGRILAFRGAILHRGGVPTRICFEERLTVAYKLRVPEIGNGDSIAASMPATAGRQADSARSAKESVAAVDGALTANDYVLAARLAREATSAGLAHPVFFQALAAEAERDGRNDEALSYYEQARVLTPRNAKILEAMGLCLTRMSRFQEAIYLFEQAIRVAPAYAPAHHRLGLALAPAGRWDLAERAHMRAAQLDPRYAEAIACIAAIAARKGDEKVARAQAERALKLDPSNVTALEVLATLESHT
jgi:SM-20-related protein